MDALSAVEDEVALEGLEGITIPTLWIRLDDRKPKFPLKLDDYTKAFLWSSLVHNTELAFYELPQDREDVELYDRYKGIDPDTGIETIEHSFESRKDLYPVQIIPENKDMIQGSCVFFRERREVTEQIRSTSNTPLLSLDQAWERFGRKLVVVASQKIRFRTLIGNESDPELKISDESYCILERVGRARWQGELQRDLHVCSFKMDARKIHYLRKSLVQYGLVTMQSHVLRFSTGQQQHSILLLLNRFHVNRRSKYDILMERVSNILLLSPGQFCTLMVLRSHLNVDECTFKRIFQYMRSSKLVEFCRIPLEELDPEAGPCINKKGNKVHVRCLKLIKPYSKKGDPVDDDDNNDEEGGGEGSGALCPEGRIMERDVLSQAYGIVVSSGTKGMTSKAIGSRMNVGKLEKRMICRQLEREGVIKGFLEDMGRQRTTKYLSHKCLNVSDELQQFAKEQERNKLLCSSAPLTTSSVPAYPKMPSTFKTNNGVCRTPALKKRKVGCKTMDGGNQCADVNTEAGAKGPIGLQQEALKTMSDENSETIKQSRPAAVEETALVVEGEDLCLKAAGTQPQSAEANNTTDIVIVKDVQPHLLSSRNHQTYQLLRRKNLIGEAIQDFKIFDGLFPLQKIINDEEKRMGLTSKCCKKTILRLIHALAREGLVKIYTTTVIQDGITKKVDIFAHPSIQPTDAIVQRVIDQVRFKISSSYTVGRLQLGDKKYKEQSKELDGTASSTSKAQSSTADKNSMACKKEDKFKPISVRGMAKSYGYQPKMHRLRTVHHFLWYLIYGHPHRHGSAETQLTGETVADPASSDPNTSDRDASATRDQDENTPENSVNPDTADAKSHPDAAPSGDEEDMPLSELKVYSVDEELWKKYIPPVRVHKDYGSGWAMLGDLLLCLPLSVFIQVIQINYMVDGLEDYLNDPEKQHYLVRCLPGKMKRQMLYKRRYIFSFHENMQKLAYLGLLQFGPVEKFKDKDQIFVYLKRNATIVDTTSAEPHYWLVSESPGRPFERRHYTFNTAEDTENYWFDLMCVCLNTPLGVIRSKRGCTEDDGGVPSFVRERTVFVGLAYLLKGSLDVCDDGSIPGDGKGAGGLDSEFFAHLKRNWLWTNHLLSVKSRPTGLEAKDTKVRLKSLCKNALRIVLQAEGSTNPRYVTAKRKLVIQEDVQVVEEPASRNKQVVGGKQHKRKRSKKEVVRVPRKKKEPRKRTPAHDERDHEALKQMTRQRVYWTVQEDSLMMLCSVASDLLNSKLKRPFVPHCVVRDILHKEFEKSRDKTSVAVGRRTRYILKNPQTLLNYRICLAEVGQDKALLKQLEENKPTDPEKPELCTESFSEYIRLLRQKFSTAMDPANFIIPDTKDQLFSRFRISAIGNGKRTLYTDTLNCTEDIHSIVLHNLIQSTLAMTNSQMKSSRSFQTFHIYSKYNQELLCQVFIQCRKRGLVNRRRVNQASGPKKNRALPILPMSYQLSQSYYRCFTWRFPQVLCTDAFRFIRNLFNKPRGEYRPFTDFYQETENRSPDGEVVESKKTAVVKKDEPHKETNEKTPVKPSETPISDSIIGGDKDQPNANQPGAETEQSKEIENGVSSDPVGEETERSGETPAEPPDVSDMLQFSLDSPGGACVAALSLISLGLLSVFMSIPKQMVVVDSTLVDSEVVKSMASLDDEEDYDEDGEDCKRMEVKAHQASHTKYLMMRGYCAPGIVKMRNLSTNDNIVVESCIIKLQLRDTPAHNFFTVEAVPVLDFSKWGPPLLPPALTFSIQSCTSPGRAEEYENHLTEHQGYTPQDVEACALLRKSLEGAGERGLDVQQLYQTHRELELPESGRSLSLQQYMQDLEEEGQVLVVGAEGPRWVLTQHAEPWLLTIKTSQWTQVSADALPFLDNKHVIPFMRKRRQVLREDSEETPAKRVTLDTHQDRLDAQQSETLQEQRVEQVKGAEEDNPEQRNKPKGEMNTQSAEEKKEEEQSEKKNEERQGRRFRKPTRSCKTLCCATATLEDVTHKADSPEDTVSFISRPWRMVDGKLNRLVCKGMLEAVLYQIMSLPGLTQETLVQHYKDVLQPMAVLDLVQALIDMGCVKKKTLIKRPKQSLFGRSMAPAPSETGVRSEDPDTVYYEPTICCMLRLSQVLPNERHWNSGAL